jgi:putative endonuclease
MQSEEQGASSRSQGMQAEEQACRYLRRLGYRIVERNWSCRLGELDIVARDGGTLVVIEVKARTEDGFGGPEAALSYRKRRRLIAATRAYLGWTGCELPVRFDVIAVRPGRIRLLRAAFGVDSRCLPDC